MDTNDFIFPKNGGTMGIELIENEDFTHNNGGIIGVFALWDIGI